MNAEEQETFYFVVYENKAMHYKAVTVNNGGTGRATINY